nr:PAS domain-containing protein [Anaerolineae bacterium]
MEDNEGLIGILDVQAVEVSRFDASDVQTFSVLAGQVASAVLNARAFEAVQEAERQARLLAEVTQNSSVGIYVYQLMDEADPKSLTLRVANPATFEVSGIPPESILNKRMDEGTPDLATSPVPEVYTQVIRSGKPAYLGEVSYKHLDGPENLYEVFAFPLPNRSVGINVQNITARKAAEREKGILAGVAENSPVGVYVYRLEDMNDPLSLRLLVANPASENATGVA